MSGLQSLQKMRRTCNVQRYFVNSAAFQDGFVHLTGDDAHHISRVMRMTVGDEIICANGKQTALCKLEKITTDSVVAKIVDWIEECSEFPHNVTIAQGMPKGDKLELIVQKGTELGAMHFLPFVSSRSIVKWTSEKAMKKVTRLEKISKEAAEQAHRQIVPTISTPIPFDSLLELSGNYQLKIVAYEEEARNNKKGELPRLLQSLKAEQSILFAVGPEGGFTANEIMKLRENDFHVCGLGPRILRTETASLYFLSALSYETELKR